MGEKRLHYNCIEIKAEICDEHKFFLEIIKNISQNFSNFSGVDVHMKFSSERYVIKQNKSQFFCASYCHNLQNKIISGMQTQTKHPLYDLFCIIIRGD